MDISVDIRPASGLLHVGAMGEFALQEAKRTFLEMLEAVARYKAEERPLRWSETDRRSTTIERFYYGEFVAGAVLPCQDREIARGTKFAYVLQEPVLDPQRLGETVAVNRGMLVMAFDNLEDALGWLGIAPANKPDAGDG